MPIQRKLYNLFLKSKMFSYIRRAYSLFQYEAANGRINHYFKGARKVSTQIVQKAIIHQEVLTTSK